MVAVVMSPSEVEGLARERLLPLCASERERLDRIDRWYRWDPDPVRVPRGATQEMRALVELAMTPWLGLVVSTISQAMYVDGYRSPAGDDAAVTPWQAWQRNDWDARQLAIHRGALAYGYAWATVLPGEVGGERAAVMRGVSPRRMQALYDDPAEDDWPVYAVDKRRGTALVYDDTAVYELDVSDEDAPTYLTHRTHGVGVCPVVRYWDHRDLDGRACGEVEPFIPMAARANKTIFDRLMVQHHNSWKVWTISGMVRPDGSDSDVKQAKLRIRQDEILVSEDPDTRFGSLPETPMSGFIEAFRADVESIAAVTQTPTHALTGQLINLSAEALAAARSGLTQKVVEYQHGFGKGHDQALRLAAHIEGDEAAATDWQARVTWQDMEIRSFSQAADALGKIATMLNVPVQALWARIPGVTKTDVDEWTKLAEDGDSVGALLNEMQRQAEASAVAEDGPALDGIG